MNSNPSTTGSRIAKAVGENEATATRFFCPISSCSSSVTRRADLTRHMRVHTGQGRVYCTEPGCTHEDGFSQKSNLEQHVSAVHLRERHSCPHFWLDASCTRFKCSETFSDPSSLIRHRSKRHGFDAGDDERKVKIPTPVWMKFPDSKYYTRKNKPANAGSSSLTSTRVPKTMPALLPALLPSAILGANPACPPKAPRGAPITTAGRPNTLARHAPPASSAFERAR